MPLFDDLQYFSVIFAPNYVTFDPWVWHKKRSDNISSFPPKGFSAELCPFEVLKRKKFVMATPPKLFDGIP